MSAQVVSEGKAIGQRIKQLRASRKITMQVVASHLGLSHSGYTKIENGNRRWTPEHLSKVADLLGVSVADLISGDTPPSPSPGSLAHVIQIAIDDARAALGAKLGVPAEKIHIEVRF